MFENRSCQVKNYTVYVTRVERTIVPPNVCGYKTKMVTIPIYGKNISNSFLSMTSGPVHHLH